MGTRGLVCLLILAAASPLVVGCSKEKLNELVDKAKQTAADEAAKVKKAVSEQTAAAKDEAQQRLNLAGRAELTLDAPLETSACYAQLIGQGDARPAVLQLRSYRDIQREEFPTLLIHAQLQVTDASELVGQTVSARMFVQREPQGAVWASPDTTPVELRILQVDQKQINAEVSGVLRDMESGGEAPVGGRLTAILP